MHTHIHTNIYTHIYTYVKVTKLGPRWSCSRQASCQQTKIKFQCLALPEKAGLGQSVNACWLSISYLTWFQDFPLLHISNPALTNQQMPSITFLFLYTLVYKISGFIQLFRAACCLLDWMLPDS